MSDPAASSGPRPRAAIPAGAKQAGDGEAGRGRGSGRGTGKRTGDGEADGSGGSCSGCSAGRLVGLHQRGRGQQNGRRWFGWPGFEGSSSEGGNVKEHKRENPIFAAGKIMPWPSVALIDPSHRPQIKGAGGGRRRRKKRRAAADKTAL